MPARVAHADGVVARIIASGGVEGRFGVPVCEGGRDLAAHPRAAYTYALVRQARAADRPLVLDTGGLLEPGGISRFAAEHDPAAIAQLVEALGYRVLALGEDDLAARPRRHVPVLDALRARGIPVVASNLRCRASARALCDAVLDQGDEVPVLEVGERRVAVLAMLDPSVLVRVEPERARGIVLVPVAEALPPAVAHARERADLVVAVLALGLEEAFVRLDALAPSERPDLVILADSATHLLFARPTSIVPAIVSPPDDDAVEVVVREDTEVRAGIPQMIAQPLGLSGVTAGEPVLDFLARIGPAYCEAWGHALEGGHLARPIDAEGITTLVAGLMRASVDADVAILNEGVVDGTFRPARVHELTESDLYVALEHDEPLYEAWVPREWIVELAGRRERHGLVVAGLSGGGGDVRVRGRPLVSRASYRVITVRFLARGGDAALPALPPGVSWTPVRLSSLRGGSLPGDELERELDPALSLREVALRELSRRDPRDPRDALSDGSETPEWVVQGFVDGTFAGSSVSNPGRYDAALLNRASTVALGLEVSLRADATAPAWTWENLGVFRYRTQWTPGPEIMGARGPGAFTEAVDQIQLRSTGSYRGLRSAPHEVWVPDPYLEVFVETEVTQPPSRGFHWLLLRPTLGARFPLTTDLELKLQTGLQAQLLQPGNEAELGVGLLLTLRPWDLLRAGDRRVKLEGLVDFFYADPGDANRWQLRGSFDASLDLAGPLAMTFGVRAYLQQDRGADVGVAIDATAGFRIGTLTRAVGP
ncbi:MAG: hypothetical protein OHK0013_10230 [Sandaracinaceae bacterium]